MITIVTIEKSVETGVMVKTFAFIKTTVGSGTVGSGTIGPDGVAGVSMGAVEAVAPTVM